MNETAEREAEYDKVLRLFGARTGLTFRPDQQHATRLAIHSAMRRLEVERIRDFARLLESDSKALDELIVELTVGETYFFREPDQFDHIRRVVLPEIRQRQGDFHTLRIWSAGCASGEEAYSLAMMCAEERLSRRAHILATDISPVGIGKARQAAYGEWSLRGKQSVRAKEHLRYHNGCYHVVPKIRRMVQFEFVNLALDVYPSYITGTAALDVILCRNVLIYFNRETVSEVARRLYHCLVPGGWLITASGDPPLDNCADYESVVTVRGIFYRRGLEHQRGPSASPARLLRCRDGATICQSLHAGTPCRRSCCVSHCAGGGFFQRGRQAGGGRSGESAGSVAARRLSARRKNDRRPLDDPDAAALHIKALANIDTDEAIEASANAARLHPLCPELHYLHAVLLLESNHLAEASQAARRMVFLDASLAIGHFLLGSILQRRGDWDDACTRFRNAKALCEALASDEVLPLTDGETAFQLARAARVQLNAIESAVGGPS